MGKRARTCVLVAGLLATPWQAVTGSDDSTGVHWPAFRGVNATGVAEGFSTPTVWDIESGKNVAWKTAIPGLGHSCPVVWEDRVFVTTAISGKDHDLKVGLYGDIKPVKDESVHQWVVLCLDKDSGEILWQKTAHEGVPKIKRHTKSSHANPTVATDGKHVVAMFGSEGLYCYDMNGKLLWEKDLGVLDSAFFMVPPAQWGFGSSPVIHDGRVIIQADVMKDSFLAAFDVKNGKEIWRTARSDYPTWSTPAIVIGESGDQVVVNGYKHSGGYDFKTGKELWKLSGAGDIPVPTPVVSGNLVFLTSAHGGLAPIYAVKTTARGDITLEEGTSSNDAIVWSVPREGAYMQTPLVYGDYLYVCRDNGVLSCYETTTGKRLYQQRLGGGSAGFTASAVAADGKIYYTSEMGDTFVVKPGPTFELLAENALDEITMATPAVSEGMLLFRTKDHVVAVAEDDSPENN